MVHDLVSSMPWFGWIAIVAIISGTVKQVICTSHRHLERIAMIRMGMNPDAPTDSSPAAFAKPAMVDDF